jgi:uncharacterized protein YkwD
MRRFLLLAVVVLAFAPLARAEDPKKDAIADFEKAVIELTNKERAKQKLPALTVQELLTKAARMHSANMAKQGKLEHVLDGKTPADRAKEAGYVATKIGENILKSDDKITPAELVAAWMESPRHRENILRADVMQIGVGVVKSAKGDWYYTQMFGRPGR